ncbi:hypothetical protein U1Q18_011062 [Sarracenia purpurea var. burkii]
MLLGDEGGEDGDDEVDAHAVEIAYAVFKAGKAEEGGVVVRRSTSYSSDLRQRREIAIQNSAIAVLLMLLGDEGGEDGDDEVDAHAVEIAYAVFKVGEAAEGGAVVRRSTSYSSDLRQRREESEVASQPVALERLLILIKGVLPMTSISSFLGFFFCGRDLFVLVDEVLSQ